MQIHVQNAPFVYNPDTISVGLGFSKGMKEKKNDWWNAVHQKYLSCVQFVYPSLPLHVTSHQRSGASEEDICFRHISTNFCLLLCILCATNSMCAAQPERCSAPNTLFYIGSQEFALLTAFHKVSSRDMFSALQRVYFQSHLYYRQSISTPAREEVKRFGW